MENKIDHWNELVRWTRTTNDKYSEIRTKARMLLGQLNTAGGKHLMKNDLECFFSEHGVTRLKETDPR